MKALLIVVILHTYIHIKKLNLLTVLKTRQSHENCDRWSFPCKISPRPLIFHPAFLSRDTRDLFHGLRHGVKLGRILEVGLRNVKDTAESNSAVLLTLGSQSLQSFYILFLAVSKLVHAV